MEFKDRFKKIRKEVGITQRELAKQSGISYSYLTKLEAGEQTNPTYEVLEALGKVLGRPLGAIFDFGDVADQQAALPTAQQIGRAYEKATPPVQRTVEVALEPFMEKAVPDKGDDPT